MKIENWPIDKSIPYARTARKISDTAVAKVAASIREFGFRQPIVVDAEGTIVAGHTRLLAAQRLGLTTVPVHVAANLTPAQIKAYRIMDNRSHEEAEWDLELLPLELEDLKMLDFDLGLTGFDERELQTAWGWREPSIETRRPLVAWRPPRAVRGFDQPGGSSAAAG
jgi:ParB-like chromosome segregation protein Spo0J